MLPVFPVNPTLVARGARAPTRRFRLNPSMTAQAIERSAITAHSKRPPSLLRGSFAQSPPPHTFSRRACPPCPATPFSRPRLDRAPHSPPQHFSLRDTIPT